MAGNAEDYRFPLHSRHHLFPGFLAAEVLQLLHVVDFKVAFLFPTELASFGRKPLDDFRPGEGQWGHIWHNVDGLRPFWGYFKVFQSENAKGFVFPVDYGCVAVTPILLQLLGYCVDRCLMLILRRPKVAF